MDWTEYYTNVLKENETRLCTFLGDKRGALGVRLFVLGTIRELFLHYKSLSSMGVDERKIICGIAKEDYIQWNVFGSMLGLGHFKGKVIKNFKEISDALDVIPIKGKITEVHYDKFVEKYSNAFKRNEKKGLGLAAATRLLAMKRPDNFVCLNGGNKHKISRMFEIKNIAAKDFEGYWDSLIKVIRATEWWKKERPICCGNLEMHIWLNRVALIDSYSNIWF